MMTESTPPARRPGRWSLPPWTRAAIPLVLGLAAAYLVLNQVFMPRFVRRGQDIEVPDLRRQTLAQAVELLTSVQLAARDTVDRVDPAPAGTVIDQDPAPGRRIKVHRRVRLVVSRGPEERAVPELAGQSLRFARVALGQEDYVLGDVIYVPAADVPPNAVVATDPPPGTNAGPGARVSLLVSSGSPRQEWVLPDLEGRDLEDTAERLTDSGFQVDVVESRSWRRRHGTIQFTEPGPGTMVAWGDTIRLHAD